MQTEKELTKATIAEVARLAGVAVSTASMALNGHAAIKTATREKVKDAAEHLGYIPHPAARTLLGQKTFSLGLLQWPSLNPLYTEHSLRLREMAAQQNYGFHLFWSDIHRPETVSPLIQSLRGTVDGVIAYNPFLQETLELLTRQLRQCRIACVFANYTPAAEHDFVASDNHAGAYMAMNFLLKKGHRRIAVFSSPSGEGNISPSERGIIDALAEYGLEFHPSCVVRHTVATYRRAFEICHEMLKSEPRPTALFARSDFIAVGAIRAAHTLGLRPGQDLDIIGMDNIEQGAYCVPALSTVGFDYTERDKKLVDLLIRRINGEEFPPEHIFIKPELILRESAQ